MLAMLIDFPKSSTGPSDTGLSSWAWHHRVDHQDIASAVKKQLNITLPQYEIEPMTFTKDSIFLLRNQQMHSDMNAALGLSGVDLSTLNFDDRSQVQAWLFQHFQEHSAAHAKLKI